MKFSREYHRKHVHHDAHIENILVFEEPNTTILKKYTNIFVNRSLNNFDLALTFMNCVLLVDQFFYPRDLFLKEFLRVYTRNDQKFLIALIIFLIRHLLFEDIAIY